LTPHFNYNTIAKKEEKNSRGNISSTKFFKNVLFKDIGNKSIQKGSGTYVCVND
jgi:hypothetical protein